MPWEQFLILIATLAGLFIWNRTESRADYRHLENAVRDQIGAIREDMKEFREGMKDFHTRLALQDLEFKMRLTAIEENRK